MADDENERGFSELVAWIRDQLEQGNLDRLTKAQETLQATLVEVKFHSPRVEIMTDLKKAVADFNADFVVIPAVNADARVLVPVPADVVDAIQTALPKLANKIQARPRDAVLWLTWFMALMAVLQTAMAAYALLHPNAAPPVVQIFNSTVNVLNVLPPAH